MLGGSPCPAAGRGQRLEAGVAGGAWLRFLQWSWAKMERDWEDRELSHVADLQAWLASLCSTPVHPVPARVPAPTVDQSHGFLLDFKWELTVGLLLINLIFLPDASLLVLTL